MEEWLSGAVVAGLTHAQLEEQVDARGRELLRRLYQDHLDLRAAREQRREKATAADGVARTRAETGHTRPLATVFGQVTVTRIAYRAPGAANLHPADAVLNLPEEKHSHGLRKLAAAEAPRGSFEAAGEAITRATGATVGKRQVEQLGRRTMTSYAFCFSYTSDSTVRRVASCASPFPALAFRFDRGSGRGWSTAGPRGGPSTGPVAVLSAGRALPCRLARRR